MKYYYLLVSLILFSGGVFSGIALGGEAGRRETWRDAFNNGVAIKEIVGEKVVYRWIETHKIGYDAK